MQLKTIAEIRFGLLQIKRILDINKTLVIGTCMLFLYKQKHLGYHVTCTCLTKITLEMRFINSWELNKSEGLISF